MHLNPVKRGLAEKPEDSDWSSLRAYAFQQVAPVRVNCQEWSLTISYSSSRHPALATARELKMRRKIEPPPPLRNFDYNLVSERMEGVLTNVDRDLQRRIDFIAGVPRATGALNLTLLDLLVRFARNSYHAVLYLAGDAPEDHLRKKNYVLVVPAINRQLMDLLFSLVYMLDDFETRAREYHRSGWREVWEEYQQLKTRFGDDPLWRPHLQNLLAILRRWEQPFGITRQEKKKPNLIPYWKTPTQLKEEKTKSRPYLRYLDTWLYGDISAQAHLSFGGLIKSASMVLAELVGGQTQEMIEGRTIQQFHFVQISRTAIITLAIATEIDAFLALGNRNQILMLWNVFGEYVPEAKEMYEQRYRELLQVQS